MQSFCRLLENYGGLPRNQPSRLIFNQRPLDAEPRSPYPDGADQDSDKSAPQTRKQGPWEMAGYRLQPRKPHGNRFGQRPEQNHRCDRSPDPPPAEGIPCPDFSRRTPAHPRDPAAPLPLQFYEGFESVIPFGEEADKDACFIHLFNSIRGSSTGFDQPLGDDLGDVPHPDVFAAHVLQPVP